MKFLLTIISVFFIATASAASAQDQVKVGDVLDLEERILVKKMMEEAAKPNPNAPPPLPVSIVPKTPKIVYPTETVAVYGTSATFYEGELTMGGKLYTVRNGSPVQGYIVTSVSPNGIELTKYAVSNRNSKKKTEAYKKTTLFAPRVTR
jgi:hypothetical protein